MKHILAFGEILWDIIDGHYFLGGAPLNFASHVQKCGHHSSIISAVGADDLGDKALLKITDYLVNTQLIERRLDQATGTVSVQLHDGQPEYDITQDVAWDHITNPFKRGEASENYELFYFGTLAQRSETSRQALHDILNTQKFKHVFYDVNLRKGHYSKAIISTSLKYASILKLNDDEVLVIGKLLFDSAASIPAACQLIKTQFPNIDIIIITMGSKGCDIYQDGMHHQVEAQKVTVKDTIGAGDAFSAAFVASYINMGDSILAAEKGNKLGAFVASSEGAIPDYDLSFLN